MIRALSFIATVVAAPALAQTPSAADLAAQVDALMAEQNPYLALLNDPDERRSLAAMQLMLDAGDPALRALAIEFGLFSASVPAQDLAFRSVLASGPTLTAKFDGADLGRPVFDSTLSSALKNSYITDENTGFTTLSVGDWLQDMSCYVDASGKCMFTLTNEGIFFNIGNWVSAQMFLQPDDSISGEATVYGHSDHLTINIRLLQ